MRTGRALYGLVVLLFAGCASEREKRPYAELDSARLAFDTTADAEGDAAVDGLFARLGAEAEAYREGKSPTPPTIDILVVSGGGDWGAFGAGVLKGWGRVTDPAMRRPRFDIVTGVSTGALIAPFAFLGDDAAIDRVDELYRHPAPDWVDPRGFLTLLFGTDSLATLPGLERDMRAVIDRDFLARVADSGKDGRLAFVSATNVDYGSVRAFELAGEARRAIDSGDLARFHTILFASSAIPGVFPPREIEGSLYVDGAMTGNILYGAKLRGDRSLYARWTRRYSGLPMPKTRYWVIFNNQLRFPPEITQPALGEIVTRGLFISTQQATVSAIRHLFAQSALEAKERGIEIEVRMLAIEDDWRAKTPGSFVAETMNDLADMGARLGADPKSWRSEAP